MSPTVKRALNFAGLSLGAAGVVFVGVRLHSQLSSPETDDLGRDIWITVALLSMLSAGNSVVLALAWRALLARAGATTSRRWSTQIYGITQLAKYVPGNIFQFAGRQSLGAAAGVGAGPLAKSTALELVSLSTAGGLFGLLLISRVPAVPEAVAISLFLVCAGLSWILIRRHLGSESAFAFVAHLTYLAVTGVAFVLLLAAVVDDNLNESYVVGVFVVGWLAGLLTPGSPAGLGVRETVLLGLLGGLDSAGVVQAVVLGRVVSISGDLAFFVVAALSRCRDTDPASDRTLPQPRSVS